ncbi:MAG TPA: PH domain-containing protein [Blastocatellia bacterium]|nr:PH domain-containing protein [Blastocatellia bacterium]
MFCHSCGKQLIVGSAFCNGCGAPVKLAGEERLASSGRLSSAPPPPVHRAAPEPVMTLPPDQVIFRIRPAFYETGVAYALATLLSLLGAGVTGYFSWPFQPALILAVIFFLIPAYKHIQRNRIVYTLTPNKIEIDSGLFARTTRNIPLRNIQDVTTSTTIGQRLTGLGDVIIDSASDAGKITMRSIRNPHIYADLILAQLHRWN